MFVYVYTHLFSLIFSLVQDNIDKEYKANSNDKENKKTDSDDEYVYDVYYRDDSMILDDDNEFRNISALYDALIRFEII